MIPLELKEVKHPNEDTTAYQSIWSKPKLVDPKEPLELAFPLPNGRDKFVSAKIALRIKGKFNRAGLQLELRSLADANKGTMAYRTIKEPDTIVLTLTLNGERKDKEAVIKISTMFQQLGISYRVDELLITDNEFRRNSADDFTGYIDV